MEALSYAVIALGILAYALVSARAERSIVTPPMAFVAFGYLIGQAGLGLVTFELEGGWIHLLAELTLIVILFTDASRIDLKLLWREHRLPVRLLAVGLPLSMLAGALAGVLLFDSLGLWQVVLLGVVLAPTDAALGQAVVSSPRVPARIRQALNVESGLNDGIALPFLLAFLSIASVKMTAEADTAHWIGFGAKQILLGPLVGGLVGYAGAKLLQLAHRTGWINTVFLKLSAVGLALLAFGLAELVHGNGFIAAFAAGLLMGNTAREICHTLYEFGVAEAQLLVLLTFTIFGGLVVPQQWPFVTATTVVYALLSLTVVRMLPVAVSLIGTKLKPVSVLFIGWFGPRGVASILYAFLIIEKAELPGLETVLSAVMLTVLLSVFLHGLTARPGAAAYASAVGGDTGSREHQEVEEMPLRLGGG